MKIKKKKCFLLIRLIFLCLFLISSIQGRFQSTDGYTSDDLTSSGACTISSDITISGSLKFLRDVTLVMASGVAVTVTNFVNGSSTYEQLVVVDSNDDNNHELEIMPYPLSQEEIIYLCGVREKGTRQIQNTGGQVLSEGVLSGEPVIVNISGLKAAYTFSTFIQNQLKIIVK